MTTTLSVVTSYWQASQKRGCGSNAIQPTNALADSGSSFTSISPELADRILNELRWKQREEGPFKVKNGSEGDLIFDGTHFIIPVKKPMSDTWIKIKFFVAPQNECPYQMILGWKDCKRLGYRLCLELEDGFIIFRNEGNVKRYKPKQKSTSQLIHDIHTNVFDEMEASMRSADLSICRKMVSRNIPLSAGQRLPFASLTLLHPHRLRMLRFAPTTSTFAE